MEVYYYRRRDAKTGKIQLEGTSTEISWIAPEYQTKGDVTKAFLRNEEARQRGAKTKYIWERELIPAPESSKPGPKPSSTINRLKPATPATRRVAAARQDRIAAAAKPQKPDTFAGSFSSCPYIVPEKDAVGGGRKPPKLPGVKADALDWAMYEIEFINYLRRLDGKDPISYGDWQIGRGVAGYKERVPGLPQAEKEGA